jgi:anti-sigma factor RsiW
MDHPTPERLQLYVDQRLADVDRHELDLHIAACPPCAGEVRGLRDLLSGLDSMRELCLPAEFAAEMAEEVVPSEEMEVAPARRSLLVQAVICLIILLTSGALLTVVDTPVTDPSDDVLGAVDLLLGSPFQASAPIIAALAIMALAGVAALALMLGSTPRPRPQRRQVAPSRVPRRRR